MRRSPNQRVGHTALATLFPKTFRQTCTAGGNQATESELHLAGCARRCGCAQRTSVFVFHCSLASATLRHRAAVSLRSALTTGTLLNSADRSQCVAASLNSAAERGPDSQSLLHAAQHERTHGVTHLFIRRRPHRSRRERLEVLVVPPRQFGQIGAGRLPQLVEGHWPWPLPTPPSPPTGPRVAGGGFKLPVPTCCTHRRVTGGRHYT